MVKKRVLGRSVREGAQGKKRGGGELLSLCDKRTELKS